MRTNMARQPQAELKDANYASYRISILTIRGARSCRVRRQTSCERELKVVRA